eukprot:CAMPEP_0172588608 /NCGR_PEP_ID=MMETSP1068-20121228/7484_1 /TAXON_ID=35684 /ORGANISM="Pseudopedinella elastica, Strain CCMP716" /LENGTH=222 /DNA_ID=CAMNT_0013383985 /DNA_START=347 /DNA_END=1016 /DNA_ORIENTATION=+
MCGSGSRQRALLPSKSQLSLRSWSQRKDLVLPKSAELSDQRFKALAKVLEVDLGCRGRSPKQRPGSRQRDQISRSGARLCLPKKGVSAEEMAEEGADRLVLVVGGTRGGTDEATRVHEQRAHKLAKEMLAKFALFGTVQLDKFGNPPNPHLKLPEPKNKYENLRLRQRLEKERVEREAHDKAEAKLKSRIDFAREYQRQQQLATKAPSSGLIQQTQANSPGL